MPYIKNIVMSLFFPYCISRNTNPHSSIFFPGRIKSLTRPIILRKMQGNNNKLNFQDSYTMFSFLKTFMAIIISTVTIHASFEQEISKIAKEISEELKLSPDRPLYITCVPDNDSYMLPMGPVYNELKKKLRPHVSEIRFRSPMGNEMITLINIIRGGTPLALEDIPIDSLILTGGYFLMNKDLDRVNCVLKIQDIYTTNIYQSSEFTIFANDCPPELNRKLFNTLVNKEAYGEIEYKRCLIEKLEILFNTTDNDLLIPPACYVFVNKNNYAIPYQLNAFKEILNLKYGISYFPESKDSIIVKADGTVSFIKNGKERQLQKVIDGEPLYPNFPSRCDSYEYSDTTSKGNGSVKKMETRKISTEAEFKVRDKIFEMFTCYYPKLFNPFNYEKLDKIFADRNEPSILTGIVIPPDPSTGKEIVIYRWVTKDEWLGDLKKRCDS